MTNHQTVILKNKAVTEEDVTPSHKTATAVVFERCTSTTWDAIGRTLVLMPQLQTLSLRYCDIGDALWQKLSSNKSLLQLRVGSGLFNAEHCGLTESRVA